MNWRNKNVLVTGGAGFIGSHLVDELLRLGSNITIIDNFDPYYSSEQKERNLASALEADRCRLIKGSILDEEALESALTSTPSHVFHLAAKAGVRASLKQPSDYFQTNVIGTIELLEKLKHYPETQLIFTSSSSVYGQNPVPFKEDQRTNIQISPYASSKKAAELICQTYAKLYKIPTTILRLFTVYGPRGRPDMAPYKFINSALNNKPILKYGNGSSSRDYTYVDDIVSGLIAAAIKKFKYEIINLGEGKSITLSKFIQLIERKTKTKIEVLKKPQPPGDATHTLAEISKAKQLLDWEPETDLAQGIEATIDWFKTQKATALLFTTNKDNL